MQIKAVVSNHARDVPTVTELHNTGLDVQVIALSWVRIACTRTLRVYLQSVLGILLAGGVGADSGVLPEEFAGLMWSAVRLGMASATVSLIQNTIELLNGVDSRFPALRA